MKEWVDKHMLLKIILQFSLAAYLKGTFTSDNILFTVIWVLSKWIDQSLLWNIDHHVESFNNVVEILMQSAVFH